MLALSGARHILVDAGILETVILFLWRAVYLQYFQVGEQLGTGQLGCFRPSRYCSHIPDYHSHEAGVGGVWQVRRAINTDRTWDFVSFDGARVLSNCSYLEHSSFSRQQFVIRFRREPVGCSNCKRGLGNINKVVNMEWQLTSYEAVEVRLVLLLSPFDVVVIRTSHWLSLLVKESL